ncbi:hypothetical protein FS749_015184, partial [Ceratobasidium sp. UAMH 11750]
GCIKHIQIHMATFRTGGPITVFMKFYAGGYLAVSNPGEVAVTCSGHASKCLANTKLALFEPFDGPQSKVTGLLLSSHRPKQLKLIITGSNGIV